MKDTSLNSSYAQAYIDGRMNSIEKIKFENDLKKINSTKKSFKKVKAEKDFILSLIPDPSLTFTEKKDLNASLNSITESALSDKKFILLNQIYKFFTKPIFEF